MNRYLALSLLVTCLVCQQCRISRQLVKPDPPRPEGMEGLSMICPSSDTIHSILVSKSEALLTFDNERYEVTLTLYSKKDSIIYLSAVNSGFEILRASVEPDTIRVIDRLNRIVYRTPLYKRFGYQHPVDFNDLQNLISSYFLCDDLELGKNSQSGGIGFEFDRTNIKKRIHLDGNSLKFKTFEFYHHKTNEYVMGERTPEGIKIFSNFMISDFEIFAQGGVLSYNREVKVKMSVNPSRYDYIDLQ